MTVYLIDIQRREETPGTLGPFASRAGAVQAVRDYVAKRYRDRDIEDMLRAYGGDLTEGTFSSEDETIDIYERELQP